VSSFLHESLFGEAIGNAAVGAWLARGESVLALNAAVCDLTGYSREEIIAGLVPPLAADDESEAQAAEIRAGRRSHGTARLVRKDERVISVSYVLSQSSIARDPVTLGLLWEAG
jgi:PAS domain S-box-containing protein